MRCVLRLLLLQRNRGPVKARGTSELEGLTRGIKSRCLSAQEGLSPAASRRRSPVYGEAEMEAADAVSDWALDSALSEEDSSHGIAAQRAAARRWEEAQAEVCLRKHFPGSMENFSLSGSVDES